jgi:hypothetical protein
MHSPSLLNQDPGQIHHHQLYQRLPYQVAEPQDQLSQHGSGHDVMDQNFHYWDQLNLYHNNQQSQRFLDQLVQYPSCQSAQNFQNQLKIDQQNKLSQHSPSMNQEHQIGQNFVQHEKQQWHCFQQQHIRQRLDQRFQPYHSFQKGLLDRTSPQFELHPKQDSHYQMNQQPFYQTNQHTHEYRMTRQPRNQNSIDQDQMGQQPQHLQDGLGQLPLDQMSQPHDQLPQQRSDVAASQDVMDQHYNGGRHLHSQNPLDGSSSESIEEPPIVKKVENNENLVLPKIPVKKEQEQNFSDQKVLYDDDNERQTTLNNNDISQQSPTIHSPCAINETDTYHTLVEKNDHDKKNQRNTKKVQFNGIMPLDVWELEEKTFSVYVAVGSPNLVKWDRKYGPCDVNNVGNGFYIVKLILCLDFKSDLLNGISYKYCVYSSKDMAYHYEHLHGAPIKKSRFLQISREDAIQRDIYQQFDTFIVPDRINKAENILYRILPSWLKKDESIQILPPLQMRACCMKIYLQPARDVLLSGQNIENFITFVDDCVRILMCMCEQFVGNRTQNQPWKLREIARVFGDWSKEVVLELLSTASQHCLISGIVLASILYKFRNQFDGQYANYISYSLKIELLKLLVLSTKEVPPLLEKNKSNLDSKNYFTDAIKFFLISVNIESENVLLVILQALPLYYYLTDGLLTTHRQIDLINIKWGDRDLVLTRLQKFLRHKKG